MSSASIKQQGRKTNQPAAVAVPDQPTTTAPQPELPAGQSVASPSIRSAVVEVPMADPPTTGHMAETSSAWHVDAQLRDLADRETLMQIRSGLDQCGARTKDGRRVVSYADTIRWLIQEIQRQSSTA